jgi:hypothetical protein
MSQYPAQIDNLITLLQATDKVSPVAGYIVNSLRSAILQIEMELGLKPSGIYSTVRARLDALEATLNDTNGAGNLIVANIPLMGQTPIWDAITNQWLAGGPPTLSANPIVNNFASASIITTGGIQSGPTQSTQLSTGLIELRGKLILNKIELSEPTLSNPGQGIIYFDGYTNQFLVSQDGYAYTPMIQEALNPFTANGDLSGNYASQEVIGIRDVPVSATTPINNQVLTFSSSNDGYWYAAALPAFPTIPTTLPPDGYAGGNLSGTYPNPIVSKINGAFVPAAGAGILDGYILQAQANAPNTSTYVLAYAPLNLSKATSITGILPAANQAPQTLSGQVSGLTNATVVNSINGASVPPVISLAFGSVLQASGGNSLAYGPVYLNNANSVAGILPATLQAQQPLSGDVGGFTGSSLISSIQGIPVSASTPTTGQVFAYDGTAWVPTTTAAQQPLVGDVDGYIGTNVIASIQGIPVEAPAPTPGQVFTYDGYAWVAVQHPLVGDVDGYIGSNLLAAIQGTPVSSTPPTINQVFAYDGYVWEPTTLLGMPSIPTGPASGDLDGYYPGPQVVGLIGIPILNIAPTNGQTLQYNDGYASWVATSSTAIFVAGEDLIGTSTAQTVVGLQTRAVSSNAPSDGNVLTWVALNNDWEPVAPTPIPASLPPNGSAAGDLSGTYPNPTVSGLQGNPINNVGPVVNDVLLWDGYAWMPTNISSVSLSGPAGGDLDGTYPNPGVARIQGNMVSTTTPTDGYVLTWVAVNNDWEPKPTAEESSNPTGPAGGDLSGSYPDPFVSGLQGITISATIPTTSQVLQYNGTDWVPTTLAASYPPNGPATGDLDGYYPDPKITSIDGYVITNNGGTAGVFQSNGTTLSFATLNLSDGYNFVSGILPNTNQASQAMSGDVDGYTDAAAVIKLNGNPILSQSLAFSSDGYVLTWDYTDNYWLAKPIGVASSVNLSGDISGTSNTAILSKIDGYTLPNPGSNIGVLQSSGSALTWGTVNLASSSYVSGILPIINQASQTMGGAVGGTTASSTISLTSNGFITGVLPNTNQASQVMSGDVDGFTDDATVIKIQGNAVASQTLGSIDDGYVLTWINADGYWKAQTPTLTSYVTMGGDISGESSSATVLAINGSTVPAGGALTDGYVLQVSGSSSLEYAPINLGGGSNYVIGTLPNSNQAAQNMGGAVGGTTAASTINLTSNSSITGVLPAANQAYQTLGGDLSGTTALATVIALDGYAIAPLDLGASQDGYILTWVNASSQWQAKELLTQIRKIVSTSVNYTTLQTDSVILVASQNTPDIVITLVANPITGTVQTVKNSDGYAETNNITIEGSGASTIDGQTEWIMAVDYQAVDFIFDGNNWFII